ncbi:LPS-assembly protein LptD [Aeoliella mucimassa]|nr:hypothetical protein [Aeoliella mucimassa]
MLATPVVEAEVFLPRPLGDPAIAISANAASKWQDGAYEVWHLSGGCSLAQGDNVVTAGEAIVWIDPPEPDSPDQVHKVLVYAEPETGRAVTLTHRSNAVSQAEQTVPQWFGRWRTGPGVAWSIVQQSPPPAAAPAIYTRASAQLQASATQATAAMAAPVRPTANSSPVQQVQFEQYNQPLVAPPGPEVPNALGVRKVRIVPRSDVGTQYDLRQTPSGEAAVTISGGVQVIIEGLKSDKLPTELGSVDVIDIQADRIVAWSAGSLMLGTFEQRNDVPLEIYMEGNIVFRQGDRTVYADRMYYDVRRNVGTIINAELLTPLSNLKGVDYAGLVRLKANVIEQLDASRFVAHDALLTASRLEVPSFHLGSGTITFENSQRPKIDPYTGTQAVNPVTLEPEYESTSFAQSRGNVVYLSNFPIFYWPTLATDLEKPSYYVSNLRVRNDRIYGFQTLVDLDVWQVLGMRNKPPGVDWDVSLDYLNKRGFGYGTTVEYSRDSFFDILGPTSGLLDAWFVDDKGVDNLGFGRRTIAPEETFRGRVFWNHRQKFADGLLEGWTSQAEIGWISDRTFLEQYYEQEWDERKDQLTGVRLKKVRDNWSLGIEANGQLNGFVTQTQWLPRFDHYMLGQDLANESVTWSSHTSLAYANQNIAGTPSDPTLAGQFALLPWEQTSTGDRIDGKGERLLTRHQLAMPLNFEPFKVVPYATGELGHWGADLEGNSLDRAYYQLGMKASIPFWTANPAIQDPVFNLNGLAHKVVFDVEASYSDSNRDMTELPMYDELDDDVFDDIRRRLFYSPFGGPLANTYFDPTTSPTTIDRKFDPRYYLLRTNTQGLVTSPAMEVADDLSLVRMGMRHRLQTKRGTPGQQHIVDWLTFDSNVTWFPNDGRDNYGSDFGLADYDLRWHLGDRFTLLSDGAADFFGDGLRTISAGMLMNRPSRGNMYLGYRTLRGPFTADVLTATLNYRMGPKWVASASAVIDFSEAGNIGQSLTFSRIGESLIVSVGANIDESKDNVGFNLLIEPRFLPSLNLTKSTGIDIPPVGAGGLE